jgi:hypothetical protein
MSRSWCCFMAYGRVQSPMLFCICNYQCLDNNNPFFFSFLVHSCLGCQWLSKVVWHVQFLHANVDGVLW